MCVLVSYHSIMTIVIVIVIIILSKIKKIYMSYITQSDIHIESSTNTRNTCTVRHTMYVIQCTSYNVRHTMYVIQCMSCIVRICAEEMKQINMHSRRDLDLWYAIKTSKATVYTNKLIYIYTPRKYIIAYNMYYYSIYYIL